ncbi:hypothetical protein [Actinomadura sp. 21ATH]|uniref:hypothetical protein n=1 Tax=Actinomadura sp. 21ATH TaxID=1735444 RepID=UPI0035BFABFA
MTHDGVPPPLADPPWRRRLREHEAAVAARRRARGGVPRVDGLEAPGGRLIVWAPGERRTWLAPFERPAAVDGGWEEAVRRYVDGELTDARSQAAVFGLAPEELVRPLLPDWRPALTEETGKALAARFGTDVHHIVFANAKAKPYRLGPVLMPFRDVEVARLMADWLHRLKSARDIAREWLLRHVHRHARQPGRRDAAADRLAHAARSRGLALPPEES